MMKGSDCTYPLKGSIVRPLILSRSSVIRGTLCLPGGDELGVLNLCVGSNCKYKYNINMFLFSSLGVFSTKILA